MRPLLRGYVHQAAFFIALVACALLIHQSRGTLALTANLIYSISLIGLFGTSALYHFKLWSHHTYTCLRRIDHAAIFALIAGSATPICLLGLKGKLGNHLLLLIWSVAIIGMLITLFWSDAPKWIRAALYVATGWIAIAFLPEIMVALGIVNLWLLLTGGIIYTIGAFIYAFKWPDLFPSIFGYHELFHIFVVIAAGFHFYVIYSLIV